MPAEEVHRVVCHLDELLERRGMTLTELAGVVGVTVVNLSVLKNNRAKAVRYSTLTAVCDALACQPGDLLSVEAVTPGQANSSGAVSRLAADAPTATSTRLRPARFAR